MRTPVIALLLVAFLRLSAQPYNYYFGNLHAHTGFSDGNKDSSASGVSKPDGSFAYAKASKDFDFLGISEHNHFSTAKNPGFRLPLYQNGLSMADAANEEGKFLALYGMEYGVSSNYNGHVIVYGFNQLIGWETGVGGMTGDNYDVYNAKSDYAGLFAKVNRNPASFCYLAHPDFDNFSTGGTWETALANAPYNASFDSAIIGMPLRNGLATSAAAAYTSYPQSNYFNYYKKILYQGYHLGIGYDHDNHYTNFGRGNGGRLVLLAPSLTRANLYAAMKAMRFYGSDDANAKVSFLLEGQVMGSQLTGSVFPSLQVIHNDADGEQADTIRIWKGYRNKPGLWADVVHTALKSNTTLFTDYEIRSGYEYYYFAEIRQADGQWIVTSPIWYRPSGIVGLTESEVSRPLLFPNPVRSSLSISVPFNDEFLVTISDLSGRVLRQEKHDQRDTTVSTTELLPGVYLVTLCRGSSSFSQRLVIE